MEFTLCEESGLRAEEGVCPQHHGDACLRQFVPKSEFLKVEDLLTDLGRERQTRTAELARELGHKDSGAEILAFAAVMCEQAERRAEEQLALLEKADQLLKRLAEWDVMNLPTGSGDDGPYWKKEIALLRNEIYQLRELEERHV